MPVPARLVVLLTLFAGAAALLHVSAPGPDSRPGLAVSGRLPADFEAQHLVLPWHGLETIEPGLATKIATAVDGRLQITLLHNEAVASPAASPAANGEEAERATEFHHLSIDHDTAWIRDYGPLPILNPGGQLSLLDTHYYFAHRRLDDRLPRQLAQQLSLPLTSLPVTLCGGNLLSNGQGLVLSTHALVSENLAHHTSETQLREILATQLGVKQLLLLEPLKGEITGHVDVFATFTSADTVVIGQYDPQVDATNAAILDRNAERLARLRVAGRPLRVERIVMPPHLRDVWPTYTNVIFAQGVLLMPIYSLFDIEGRKSARATFARLLPGWKIVEIEASQLVRFEGALRCVSLALPGNQAAAAPSEPVARP